MAKGDVTLKRGWVQVIVLTPTDLLEDGHAINDYLEAGYKIVKDEREEDDDANG